MTVGTIARIVVPGRIRLDAGMPGFPGTQSFDVEPWGGPASSFFLLRPVDGADPWFVVVDPAALFPDYRAEIDDFTADRLGIDAGEDALTLVVLTVGDRLHHTTANLLAPLVVNPRTGRAAQVALPAGGLAVNVPVRPAA
ncbi:MAG: flagellar assembly protein FliW [Acidimicrobiales bacterium]